MWLNGYSKTITICFTNAIHVRDIRVNNFIEGQNPLVGCDARGFGSGFGS